MFPSHLRYLPLSLLSGQKRGESNTESTTYLVKAVIKSCNEFESRNLFLAPCLCTYSLSQWGCLHVPYAWPSLSPLWLHSGRRQLVLMLGLGHCLSSHITVPGKARSKHHGHKGSSFKCFHQCSPRQTLSLTKWKFKWIFVLFFSRHVTVFQDLKPKFSKFKSRLWELQQKPNYATERETGRERSI